MYNKVLPAFVEFQKEKNISEKDGFFDFPKCYFAEYDEELQDSVIIMEDLKERECKMWDKFIPINYEHAKMVMESLGPWRRRCTCQPRRNRTNSGRPVWPYPQRRPRSAPGRPSPTFSQG